MANLNMAIANTHRTGGQLVGLQLTTGNVIAIILSAVQMIAGSVLLTTPALQGALLWLLVPIALIFLAMAILIERLTVISLMTIRINLKELSDLGEEEYQESINQKRELVIAELKRRQGKRRWAIGAMVPMALAGMGISAAVGDVFFHWVFGNLDDKLLATLLSWTCAGVISLSFVLSELFKDQTDKALASTIEDTEISKTVLANEQENFNISLAVTSMGAINRDQSIKDGVQTKLLERITPTLEENVASLFTRVAETHQAQLPSPADREAEQKLLEERLVTKITEVVAPVQAKIDELHAHTQQLALPAPQNRQTDSLPVATTGEFTTASSEAQLLYKEVQARPELVSTLLHNSHAPVQAHVNYLAQQLPGLAISEQSVSEVLAILIKEEQDTDKLVSTDEIQQSSLEVGVQKYGKAIAKEARQNPPMLAAILQAQASGISLVEIGKIASSYAGHEYLQHACLVPGNIRIALDTLNSQPPQTPTIPAINTDAFRLYEVVTQEAGLADRIWSYRERPLSELANKLAQFFSWLNIDEEVVSQVLTLIQRDQEQQQPKIEGEIVEGKPVTAPLKKQPTGGSNKRLTAPSNNTGSGVRKPVQSASRTKRKLGAPPTAPRAKWTPQVESELAAILAENPDLPLSAIGAQFGVSTNTARDWKRRVLEAVNQSQFA